MQRKNYYAILRRFVFYVFSNNLLVNCRSDFDEICYMNASTSGFSSVQKSLYDHICQIMPMSFVRVIQYLYLQCIHVFSYVISHVHFFSKTAVEICVKLCVDVPWDDPLQYFKYRGAILIFRGILGNFPAIFGKSIKISWWNIWPEIIHNWFGDSSENILYSFIFGWFDLYLWFEWPIFIDYTLNIVLLIITHKHNYVSVQNDTVWVAPLHWHIPLIIQSSLNKNSLSIFF